MKDNLSTPTKPSGNPPLETDNPIIPPLELNHNDYREYLEEFDMTVEQQNELLETLWNIMRTMVELSFDLDKIELFSTETDQDSGNQAINLLSIKDSSSTFNQVANQDGIKEDLTDE